MVTAVMAPVRAEDENARSTIRHRTLTARSGQYVKKALAESGELGPCKHRPGNVAARRAQHQQDHLRDAPRCQPPRETVNPEPRLEEGAGNRASVQQADGYGRNKELRFRIEQGIQNAADAHQEHHDRHFPQQTGSQLGRAGAEAVPDETDYRAGEKNHAHIAQSDQQQD